MAVFEDLVKSFKAKDIKGNYIFYGEEAFFIDYLTELFIQNGIADSERAFCQHIFFGKEADPNTIRDVCLTVPMSFSSSPRQLIVVKEAQNLSKKLEVLYKYMAQPIESTVLLLSFKDTKTLDKKVPKSPTIFKSEILKERDMPKWIQSQAKLMGVTIHADAISTIIDYGGTNLERIHNELEKLLISAQKDRPITAEDIQRSFGIMRDYTIYELTYALGEKNMKTVFRIIDYYAKDESKLPFELLLGSLLPFYKSLYQYKLGQRMKMSVDQIGHAIGYQPRDYWKLNNHTKYTNKYDLIQLENALITLSEMDRKRKGINGASIKYPDLLKELVLRLTS